MELKIGQKVKRKDTGEEIIIRSFIQDEEGSFVSFIREDKWHGIVHTNLLESIPLIDWYKIEREFENANTDGFDQYEIVEWVKNAVKTQID